MLPYALAAILCHESPIQAAREIKNPFNFEGIDKAARQFLEGLKPEEWLTPAPLAQKMNNRRDVGSITPPHVSSSGYQEYTTTSSFDAVCTHYLELLRKRAIATATQATFYISSQLTIQETGKQRNINWSHAASPQEAALRTRETSPRPVSQQGNVTIVDEGSTVRVSVNMSEVVLYPAGTAKPLQDEITRAFAPFLSLTYPGAILEKSTSGGLSRTNSYKLPMGVALADVLDWFQPKLAAYRLFGTLSRSERIPDRVPGDAVGATIASMQVYVPEEYSLLVQISLQPDSSYKLDLIAGLPRLPPRFTPPTPPGKSGN